MSQPVAESRLLLIGMDGLEWRVMLPLLKAGKLPAFERLMRSGVYGKLETLVPTISPIIWTSIVTGKTPAKHGIAGKIFKDDQGNRGRTFNSTDRKTKALWNIFTDFGELAIDAFSYACAVCRTGIQISRGE